MDPQEDILNERPPEIIYLQEQFGDGLQDKSLPAAQVLIEQKEAHTSDQRVPLYIP
jgi:hypothetical protein